MRKLKVKVCGMKVPPNIEEVASLAPDYMGFIFVKDSKRFVGKDFDPVHLNLLHPPTKAIGVFVDEFLPRVVDKIDFYHFDAVQLHGSETAEYCKKLRAASPDLEIIKAFSVGEDFSFNVLKDYEPHVTYFLFDAKGDDKGGNGIQFNWALLDGYKLGTPYYISGGIGPDSIKPLQALIEKSPHLEGIDINSKFEVEPGMKSATAISKFLKEIGA